MCFQDSSWNVCMSSLVMLAASLIEKSCGITDRHTNKPYPSTAVGTERAQQEYRSQVYTDITD